MARRINMLHGANPDLWPVRIPISKAFQYIGMARQTWYNKYRKEWQVEKLTDGTGSLPRATVKMLQDRWVGTVINCRPEVKHTTSWKYLYLKDKIEQDMRLQFEAFLSQTLQHTLAAAMATIEDEVPFDDFMSYLDKANQMSKQPTHEDDPDPQEIERSMQVMRQYSENPNGFPDPDPIPSPDHPNQTYLLDQIQTVPDPSAPDTDDDIPEDLMNLAQSWETMDD